LWFPGSRSDPDFLSVHLSALGERFRKDTLLPLGVAAQGLLSLRPEKLDKKT